MKDETEEKTLPASPKKLRDARRKGQVSQSKDFVAGVGLLVAALYIVFRWPKIVDSISGLVDGAAASVGRPFAEAWPNLLHHAETVLVLAVFPLAIIIFAISVIAGMIGTLGPVLSFENVELKFEHLNPIDGAKRIFSLRNVIEFAKSIVKVVVLAAAFWAVLRGFIQSLIEIPACGHECLGPMLVATLQRLAGVAVIAFLIVGVIDVLLQYRMFLREMRMTRTEQKREHKDLEGDPLIRSARRRMRREAATNRVRVGIRHAAVVIMHADKVVGLRYNEVDARVPMVVSKARGPAAAAMLAEARGLAIPIIDDTELAESLIERHAIGDRIREDLFNPIARILVKLSL